MKGLSLLSAVAATSIAAGLNAQVTTAKPDSTCTNYPDGRVECRVIRGGVRGDSGLRNRIFYRMDSVMANRAALGLELRPTGSKRDTLGVFVDAVTPKGPAETAGIIEGDRIAAINGVDLRASAADTEDSYTSGLAAHRLSREVQKLRPGSRVTLRVYSGGRFRDVQVTAGKASDVMRLGNRFDFRIPGAGGMMRLDGHGAMMFGPEMEMMHGGMEPMMRERIEPLLRERLRNLPTRIQMRSPMRTKALGPVPEPGVYQVDVGPTGEVWTARPGEGVFFLEDDLPDFDETMFPDFDDDWFDIYNDIEPVSPEEIRDLVATTIRDARSALKQLVADGVV